MRISHPRNEVLNRVAGLLQTANTEFLPLSVRCAAAEAALAVVDAWQTIDTPKNTAKELWKFPEKTSAE